MNIDPGIRETAWLLTSHGFEVYDSGEAGKRIVGKNTAEDRPFFLIRIREPADLVEETNRLYDLLYRIRIKTVECNDPIGTQSNVEGYYSPGSGAEILLENVNDEKLARAKESWRP